LRLIFLAADFFSATFAFEAVFLRFFFSGGTAGVRRLLDVRFSRDYNKNVDAEFRPSRPKFSRASPTSSRRAPLDPTFSKELQLEHS